MLFYPLISLWYLEEQYGKLCSLLQTLFPIKLTAFVRCTFYKLNPHYDYGVSL